MRAKLIRKGGVGLLALVAWLVPGDASTQISTEPSTSDFAAVFRVLHDPSLDVRSSCIGADGSYDEIRESSLGTITSTDDRLSGEMQIHTWILLNRSTLQGTIEVDVEIRDPDTGDPKFTGRSYIAMQYPGMKGILVGDLVDGTRVVANLSVTHDPPSDDPHWVSGEIGGPGVPLDLALLQHGSCSGAPGL